MDAANRIELDRYSLTINNQPIQGMDSFAALMNYLKPHEKIALVTLDHRSGNTDMVQVMVRQGITLQREWSVI